MPRGRVGPGPIPFDAFACIDVDARSGCLLLVRVSVVESGCQWGSLLKVPELHRKPPLTIITRE